jgi:hypothetical protein
MKQPTRIKKHYAFLKYAASLPAGKERRLLMKNANQEELIALCEICSNITHGHIPMSFSQKKRLCKYKKKIRCLADQKINFAKKRRALTDQEQQGQKGGFIGTLLGITLPLLASLITGSK